MHARTEAVLRELEGEEWFVHVGEPAGDDVFVVGSWQEAMQSCARAGWRWQLSEAATNHMAMLILRLPEAEGAWEGQFKTMEGVARRLMETRVQPLLPEIPANADFVPQIQIPLANAFMELEYGDVIPPGFFASYAHYCTAGRFPCGWRGSFPRGRLMIY